MSRGGWWIRVVMLLVALYLAVLPEAARPVWRSARRAFDVDLWYGHILRAHSSSSNAPGLNASSLCPFGAPAEEHALRLSRHDAALSALAQQLVDAAADALSHLDALALPFIRGGECERYAVRPLSASDTAEGNEPRLVATWRLPASQAAKGGAANVRTSSNARLHVALTDPKTLRRILPIEGPTGAALQVDVASAEVVADDGDQPRAHGGRTCLKQIEALLQAQVDVVARFEIPRGPHHACWAAFAHCAVGLDRIWLDVVAASPRGSG